MDKNELLKRLIEAEKNAESMALVPDSRKTQIERDFEIYEKELTEKKLNEAEDQATAYSDGETKKYEEEKRRLDEELKRELSRLESLTKSMSSVWAKRVFEAVTGKDET